MDTEIVQACGELIGALFVGGFILLIVVSVWHIIQLLGNIDAEDKIAKLKKENAELKQELADLKRELEEMKRKE